MEMRSVQGRLQRAAIAVGRERCPRHRVDPDRKSTRLNSSHLVISYAVFCLKKKKKNSNEMPRDIPINSSPIFNIRPSLWALFEADEVSACMYIDLPLTVRAARTHSARYTR